MSTGGSTDGTFEAVRKEAIEKVGQFNENIRMEDTEYSQRVMAAGFKTFYSPEVQGAHLNEHQESTAKSEDVLFLKTKADYGSR
ncbi:MAG: glycosyltransferase family 2 protein [Nitrososphaerales archaeon]